MPNPFTNLFAARPRNPRPADTELGPESPLTVSPESRTDETLPDGVTLSVSPGEEVGVRGDIGSALGTYQQYFSVLPRPVDDVDEFLGPELKGKMMLDAIILSTLDWLVSAALDHGVEYTPVIRDKENPDYKTASDVYDFCMRAIEPVSDTLPNALHDQGVQSLGIGHCIAEIIAPVQEGGKDPGKRYLSAYKTRAQDVTGFVVDPHMNVVGIAAKTVGSLTSESSDNFNQDNGYAPPSLRRDGTPTQLIWSSGGSLPQDWRIFSRKKFAVLANRSRFNDPRGQSSLRHIYNEWYLMQAIWPHYLKYLMKFASPSLHGSLGPDVGQRRRGGKDPIDQLLTDMLKFQNSSCIATPHGTNLNLLYSNGQGEAFAAAFQLLERRMIKGMTNQILANSETRNGSRAQAQTHQDQQNIVVRAIKRNISAMLRNDVLKLLVEINLGPQFVRFAPIPSLGGVAPEDQSSMLDSVSMAWQRGYLDESQLRPLDAEIGLPYRETAEPGFYPGAAQSRETFDAGPQDAQPAEEKPAEKKPAAKRTRKKSQDAPDEAWE